MAEREPILVVDDDADAGTLIVRWLELAGHDAEHLADGEECMAALGRYVPRLVCLDIELPGQDGLAILEQLRARHPRLPVLMLTGSRDVQTVVRAMQLGAYDFLTKPVDRTRLVTSVANALERAALGRRVSELERRVSGGDGSFEGIAGTSEPMLRLFSEVEHVAVSDISVLLHGESGSGKELVARAIHRRSGRAAGPFVAVNCAAVPENLMESEFFGHERGAFTGAVSRRQGHFEQADHGTLFLDEVAELPLALQAKLLRALQERSVVRVGASTPVKVDFRLVAASHRDLAAQVRSGAFREDLFYRLAVFELDVPPLRARVGDLPALCRALVGRIAAGRDLVVSPEALAMLERYPFPGNVRELENALQRAVVLAKDGFVRAEDLPPRIREYLPSASSPMPVSGGPTEPGVEPLRLEELEKEALRAALARCGGNVAQVVKELGMGRTTVYRKMKEYGFRD